MMTTPTLNDVYISLGKQVVEMYRGFENMYELAQKSASDKDKREEGEILLDNVSQLLAGEGLFDSEDPAPYDLFMAWCTQVTPFNLNNKIERFLKDQNNSEEQDPKDLLNAWCEKVTPFSINLEMKIKMFLKEQKRLNKKTPAPYDLLIAWCAQPTQLSPFNESEIKKWEEGLAAVIAASPFSKDFSLQTLNERIEGLKKNLKTIDKSQLRGLKEIPTQTEAQSLPKEYWPAWIFMRAWQIHHALTSPSRPNSPRKQNGIGSKRDETESIITTPSAPFLDDFDRHINGLVHQNVTDQRTLLTDQRTLLEAGKSSKAEYDNAKVDYDNALALQRGLLGEEKHRGIQQLLISQLLIAAIRARDYKSKSFLVNLKDLIVEQIQRAFPSLANPDDLIERSGKITEKIQKFLSCKSDKEELTFEAHRLKFTLLRSLLVNPTTSSEPESLRFVDKKSNIISPPLHLSPAWAILLHVYYAVTDEQTSGDKKLFWRIAKLKSLDDTGRLCDVSADEALQPDFTVKRCIYTKRDDSGYLLSDYTFSLLFLALALDDFQKHQQDQADKRLASKAGADRPQHPPSMQRQGTYLSNYVMTHSSPQPTFNIHEIMRAQLDYAVPLQQDAVRHRAWNILESDLLGLSKDQVQQHLQQQPSIADDLWFNLSQITLWQSTCGGVPDAVMYYQEILEAMLPKTLQQLPVTDDSALPTLQDFPVTDDSAVIYAAYGLWLRCQSAKYTAQQLLDWLDHSAKPTVGDEWKDYRHVVRLQKWLGISRTALERKKNMLDAQPISTDDLPRQLRFEDTDLFTDEDMEDLDRIIVGYCAQDVGDKTEEDVVDMAAVATAADSLPQTLWGTLSNQLTQAVMSLQELLGANQLSTFAYRDDSSQPKKPALGNDLCLIDQDNRLSLVIMGDMYFRITQIEDEEDEIEWIVTLDDQPISISETRPYWQHELYWLSFEGIPSHVTALSKDSRLTIEPCEGGAAVIIALQSC